MKKHLKYKICCHVNLTAAQAYVRREPSFGDYMLNVSFGHTAKQKIIHVIFLFFGKFIDFQYATIAKDDAKICS